MLLITIIGWVGMAIILSSYLLVSMGRVSPSSMFYQALNLAGAVGILINSWVDGAWPATVLFIIWAIMSIFYLINIAKSQ